MNTELARRVLDHVRMNPEQHDQDHWGERNECGTSACIAGWTIILSERDTWHSVNSSEATHQLLGIDRDTWNTFNNSETTHLAGRSYTVPTLACQVLGIDLDTDAYSWLNNEVFFTTNNTKAVENFEEIIKDAENGEL